MTPASSTADTPASARPGYAARALIASALGYAMDGFDLLILGFMLPVIAADLHAWNVVYGEDSRGGPRLVMIDGFGEKNIVPHCSMNRAHNASRTKKKYERMLRRTMAEAPKR